MGFDPEVIERDFAALAKTTIAELRAATTDAEDDAAWAKAIKEYGRLKVQLDGDANENIVHFFAVDGIGYDKQHPIVFRDVAANKARQDRWILILQKA